jgi:hypothetical protein
VGFLLAPHSRSATQYEQETEALRSIMAKLNTTRPTQPRSTNRLPINIDLLAVGIGLVLAALIRFGVIHQISF